MESSPSRPNPVGNQQNENFEPHMNTLAHGVDALQCCNALASLPSSHHTQTQAESLAEEPCSICFANPTQRDLAIIPECCHSFCVDCIMTWSSVRKLCPLCKTSFSSLLVRRDADGNAIIFGDSELGWAETSIPVLLNYRWIKIAEVKTPQDDILDSIHIENTFAHARSAVLINGNAHAHARTTFSEDQLDELEQACFDDPDEYKSFSKGSAKKIRVVSNRPFGETGYLREGRMSARPTANPSGSGSSKRAAKRKGFNKLHLDL